MYKLFITEDDRDIANAIRDNFVSWGFQVHITSDYQKVIKEFSLFQPHIVLLDISLPFYNGYHWCNEIRKISNVPIIFISSNADNMNIVMAMNMGADDFISKPFDSDVLVAKVNALIRRSYNLSTSMPILSHRGAFLNTNDNTLSYNDNKIELTKNEYRILLTLMENKGQTVTREKLMKKLWETDSFVDDNTLTVNINRLRKKLSEQGIDDFIKTKFGLGYIVE